MTNPYFKIALPGIVLILLMLLCLILPTLFVIFNPVFQWIALSTIGIPSILAAIICAAGFDTFKFKISTRALVALLTVLTIPSMYILANIWLHYRPEDGPGFGYMGIFYIFGAPFWLPVIIGWSWYSIKNIKHKHQLDKNP